MDYLKLAIDLCGGVCATADKLGLDQSTISKWKKRGQVSHKHAVLLERATKGRVTRYKLRPDIFGKAA